MARPIKSSAKRPRIIVDVTPELRHRVRLAAAKRDRTIGQYIFEAIEVQLHQDLGCDVQEERSITAQTDPVLAELWDNPKDAAYDHL